MISSLAIQPGNREAPQLQLAQLGWGDFALGSKPWQISLVSSTWALSAGTPLSGGIFVANPSSQRALPAWAVL